MSDDSPARPGASPGPSRLASALPALFERLPMGVSVWHVGRPAVPANLIFLGANPAALASLGTTLDAAMGRPVTEIAPAAEYPEGVSASIATGEVHPLGEITLEVPGRGAVTLQTLAVPLGGDEVALVTHDVATPAAPSSFTQSARLALRQLLDGLPDGVFTLRLGHLTSANRALLEIVGQPDRDAFLALEPVDLAHPESRATLATQLGLAERGIAARGEATLKRVDGTPVPVSLHLVRLDLDGPMILGIVHDLTEHRALMAQALERDRLTALGTLAAGLAHEMNNPLAFLTANLAYLGEELEAWGAEGQLAQVPGDRLREVTAALAEAQNGATRLARTVADLKAFAQADGTEADTVDLREVVGICLDLAGNELRHRAKVVTRLPEAPVPVAGERGRLGQVILPLLINAAQAIPEGDARHQRVEVGLDSGETEAVLTIRDTGEGMTEAVRRRIFDPFFTTRSVGEGSGLGLSVAHGIVASLGGGLLVESEVGTGTTVTVRLPTRTPADPATPGRPGPVRTGPPRRGRILVIDDEAMIGLALKRILGGDHEVTVTLRAGDALDLFATGETYDLVLCDLMMPDISGIDLWESVDPAVRRRMVFLTGGAFTERAEAFLARERPPLVTKPFDAEALRAMVRRRLG